MFTEISPMHMKASNLENSEIDSEIYITFIEFVFHLQSELVSTLQLT